MDTNKKTVHVVELLSILRADPRVEMFQGLVVNKDASVLVMDRWRGRYFQTFGELEAWLGTQKSDEGGNAT